MPLKIAIDRSGRIKATPHGQHVANGDTVTFEASADCDIMFTNDAFFVEGKSVRLDANVARDLHVAAKNDRTSFTLSTPSSGPAAAPMSAPKPVILLAPPGDPPPIITP